MAVAQNANRKFENYKKSGNTLEVNTSDGKYILSGSKDHTAIIWDPVGLEVETFNLSHEVKAVAFSLDKQFILYMLYVICYMLYIVCCIVLCIYNFLKANQFFVR